MESKMPKDGMSLEVMKQMQKMQNDISFLKQKVKMLEDEVDVIDGDIHEVRPEYLKKLEEIEKTGKFHRVKNVDEMRKDIESF